jgi:holliday junction DNA helicase RuvB
VIARAALKLGLEIEQPALVEIASRSRGTPRIANRLLRRVRDFALVAGEPSINVATAKAALTLYEVDELGLDRLDRDILKVLTSRFDGKPVGLSTLAVAVGEEQDTIEAVVEPFLVRMGLIARTPRGRQATAAAYRHLGVDYKD